MSCDSDKCFVNKIKLFLIFIEIFKVCFANYNLTKVFYYIFKHLNIHANPTRTNFIKYFNEEATLRQKINIK